MDAPTLADIAAVTNNDGIGNGNGAWWVIILFIILFGANGFNRYGNGDYGQYATAASQQEILFGQQFQNVNDKLNALGDGICSSTYALNNAIGTVGSAVAEAKYDNALRIADLAAAQQNCCCTTQRAIDGVNYNIADKMAAVNANIDAKFAALEKNQLEQRIADLQAQVAQQNLNAQLYGVVRYPNGYTYTAGNSPFCNCGNAGY